VGDPTIYIDTFGIDGVIEPTLEAELWAAELAKAFTHDLSKHDREAAAGIPFTNIVEMARSIDAGRVSSSGSWS